jgi:protein gp37
MRHPLPLDPPAIVRPAEDELAALAQEINAEHEAGRKDMRQALLHYHTAGERLIRARAKCKHGEWLPWLKKNVKFSQPHASRYMQFAKLITVISLESEEDWEAAEAEWARIKGNANEGEGEAVPVEEPLPEHVTLTQWEETGKQTRKRFLTAAGDSKLVDQGKSAKIEWALWSWNPVTGCEHNCPYCYARDIANLHYDQGFIPSLYPGRLKAPQNTRFPEEEIRALADSSSPDARVRAQGLANVFTCSMADLFGRWVPAEWIEAVLDTVRACPQWTFLFLTKFPIRMAEFDFPENTWVGTTVDCQARVKNAERAFRKVKAGVKWLSCEPLIEPLHFTDLGAFDWVVLGGASESTKTPEWHPPRAWVEELHAAALAAGCAVYEKDNLLHRRRGYPGLPWQEPVQAPAALRYLPTPE